MQSDLSAEARDLELALFPLENERLSESLREMKVLEGASGMLADVSGFTDARLLVRLEAIGVTPATAASLALVPLIEAAWADGAVSYEERVSAIRSLDKILFFHTIDRDVLETWLATRPPDTLFSAWTAFAGKVCAHLDSVDRAALSEAILSRVHRVSEAAGSFLGMGAVSKAEKLVKARLAGVLA